MNLNFPSQPPLLGTIGKQPVAVVMISLNEAHNMAAVLDNIEGWASEIFLVDSFSTDATVDIALRRGIYVVQRPFPGFGDQWNFALDKLPIQSPWTMKLDPDERLSQELKDNLARAMSQGAADGIEISRRLWFMGTRLPVKQSLLRVWRTGTCRFSDVLVNEHPLVEGTIASVGGELAHHDSPDLHHWYDKQNRYSTAEALGDYRGLALSTRPNLRGTPLERRMWLKRLLKQLPGRNLIMFFYCYLIQGAWRAGRVGLIWSHLRASVHQMATLKLYEMRVTGREIQPSVVPKGQPNLNAVQVDGCDNLKLRDELPT